jgi:hypothetical protein
MHKILASSRTMRKVAYNRPRWPGGRHSKPHHRGGLGDGSSYGGENRDRATTLSALVQTIVSPYVAEKDARVIISGPDVPISGSAMMSMALLLHETGLCRHKAAASMSAGWCRTTNCCWHGGSMAGLRLTGNLNMRGLAACSPG